MKQKTKAEAQSTLTHHKFLCPTLLLCALSIAMMPTGHADEIARSLDQLIAGVEARLRVAQAEYNDYDRKVTRDDARFTQAVRSVNTYAELIELFAKYPYAWGTDENMEIVRQKLQLWEQQGKTNYSAEILAREDAMNEMRDRLGDAVSRSFKEKKRLSALLSKLVEARDVLKEQPSPRANE